MKVKKKRVEWNEARGDFLPTFGYKNQGRKDKDLTDWIKEVGQDQDGTEDLFKADRDEKKKRVEKNDMQARRNKEEAAASVKGLDHRALKKTVKMLPKGTVLKSQPQPEKTQAEKLVGRTEKKKEIRTVLSKAKIATASMGKVL